MNYMTLSGVDGFMATWIDFLLLVRSEVLVHSWYVLPNQDNTTHQSVPSRDKYNYAHIHAIIIPSLRYMNRSYMNRSLYRYI